MLINNDGTKEGLVSIDEALKKASDVSLDLVQVSSSDSDPVVCKILDHGKHIFNKKKNISASKSKTKETLQKKLNLGLY